MIVVIRTPNIGPLFLETTIYTAARKQQGHLMRVDHEESEPAVVSSSLLAQACACGGWLTFHHGASLPC